MELETISCRARHQPNGPTLRFGQHRGPLRVAGWLDGLKVGKPASPPKRTLRGMLTAGSLCRRSLLPAVLLLLFSAGASSLSAQIIPGLQARPDLSIYGTLPTNVTPDFRYFGTPAVFGYSLGGFLQTPWFVGAEVRGTIQRRLNAQHQESALAGPRFAMRFGHFSPYVSVLGGAGNGWRFRNPPISGEKAVKPVEGLGGQWTVLGGVDFHVTHHLGIRLGEISYSKVYLKDWSLTPLNITAGVVYRIN